MIRLDKLHERLNDLEFQKSLDDLIDRSEFNLSLDRSSEDKYLLKMPIICGLDQKITMTTVATFEFLIVCKDLATLVISLNDQSSVEFVSTVAEIGKFIISHVTQTD